MKLTLKNHQTYDEKSKLSRYNKKNILFILKKTKETSFNKVNIESSLRTTRI